jgi:hypothetical protein
MNTRTINPANPEPTTRFDWASLIAPSSDRLQQHARGSDTGLRSSATAVALTMIEGSSRA